jgi:hypothetical protein
MIVMGSGTEVDHKLKYANDLSLGVKFRRERFGFALLSSCDH